MYDYNFYRDKIKSGDLLVWTTNDVKTFRNFELKIVQLFTQSSYDHVAIAWNIGGRLLAVEATPPEVRIFPLSRLRPFYVIPMDIEWEWEYTNHLLCKIGDKYSLLDVLKSYFGDKHPDIENPDKKWQCAEFVHYFYNKIGLKQDFGFTPKSVVDKALELTSRGLIKVT